MKWRKLAPLVALILIIAALFYGYWAYRQRVLRQWDEMLVTVKRLIPIINKRPGRRAVLWGDSLRGRAFEHYDKAFSTLKPLLEDQSESGISNWIYDWQYDAKEPRPEALKDWLVRLEPMFTAIRKGAHCEDARRTISWGDEYIVAGRHAWEIAQLTAWSCRELRQGGNELEAVRRALDSMQLFRDLMHDPDLLSSLWGTAGMDVAIDSLFLEIPGLFEQGDEFGPPVTRPDSILALDRLNSVALALLKEGLVRLDRPILSLDTVFSMAAVMVCTEGMRMLLFDENADIIEDCSIPGRAQVIESTMTLLAIIKGAGKTRNTWSSVKGTLGSIEAKLAALESDNRIFSRVTPGFHGFLTARRTAITKIRLLRMAVQDVAGQSMQIDDPFGGTLRSARFADRTRYWSVGENNVDDEGDPEKDVVLIR